MREEQEDLMKLIHSGGGREHAQVIEKAQIFIN